MTIKGNKKNIKQINCEIRTTEATSKATASLTKRGGRGIQRKHMTTTCMATAAAATTTTAPAHWSPAGAIGSAMQIKIKYWETKRASPNRRMETSSI